MTLEERIQRLEDIEAIRYLQSKYQRCVDARDFNGIAECFSDTVVSAYGNGEMSFTGKDMVIGFLMKSMSLDMPSAHMIHGGEIDIIDQANAKAKWYLQDVLINKTYSITIEGVAIYDIKYIKVDGKWFIDEIGYTRGFEYRDTASQTLTSTLSKTTFVDDILGKSADDFSGYNKAFKQMTEANKK